MRLSWRLAALRRTPIRVPRRSTTRRRFVPGLPRSVGFRPVSALPFLLPPCCCRGRLGSSRAVLPRPSAPEAHGGARPRCGLLPVAQAPPARHPRAAHLAWHHLPREARARYTKTIPLRATRSSHRGRPPLGLGRSQGSSGCIAAQRSLDTRGLLMPHNAPTQVLLGAISLLSEPGHPLYQAISRRPVSDVLGLGHPVLLQPQGSVRSGSHRAMSHGCCSLWKVRRYVPSMQRWCWISVRLFLVLTSLLRAICQRMTF